ncbi:response regulator transcription factor [Pseudomaricurvus alkylphenolicus]|uniref:response regulator transcription factor n=1 Tax=Pseudomaricurvus alkylphenolicus TaxID=1306991 RepID=UPI00142401E8|nr:response regulator transcription factor [Pseudomaricurvus alkylphenolicus]NIB44582.1 response regulator transcription factor [Pseudomaricurvus alkylphenolicus]
MSQLHILLIEDDAELAALTVEYLSNFDYRLSHEADGLSAVERILEEQPDVVLLDIMLPGKSGIDICREVRQVFSNPIIMLTARSDQIDQIIGLEMGADDYICKPVEPRLLAAKINAVSRRIQQSLGANETTLAVQDLHINNVAREVRQRGRALELTTHEYDVLYLLARNAGRVLSRESIFSDVRGIEYDGISRFVDVTISRLRHKISDDPNNPSRIKTVRNRGYLMVPETI